MGQLVSRKHQKDSERTSEQSQEDRRLATPRRSRDERELAQREVDVDVPELERTRRIIDVRSRLSGITRLSCDEEGGRLGAHHGRCCGGRGGGGDVLVAECSFNDGDSGGGRGARIGLAS